MRLGLLKLRMYDVHVTRVRVKKYSDGRYIHTIDESTNTSWNSKLKCNHYTCPEHKANLPSKSSKWNEDWCQTEKQKLRKIITVVLPTVSVTYQIPYWCFHCKVAYERQSRDSTMITSTWNSSSSVWLTLRLKCHSLTSSTLYLLAWNTRRSKCSTSKRHRTVVKDGWNALYQVR